MGEIVHVGIADDRRKGELMRLRGVVAFIAFVFASSSGVRADTFERKVLRPHKISRTAASIRCVKQAAAYLGRDTHRTTQVVESAIVFQSWTDRRRDRTFGTEYVTLKIDRATDEGVLAIYYTGETGVTSTYKPSSTMKLQVTPLGEIYISAFTGSYDVWTFHVDLSTGIAIKTETMYAKNTFVVAYECSTWPHVP